MLVQCSAHGEPHPADLAVGTEGACTICWHEPQRRVSPGQTVVVYDPSDRFVLGGGIATVARRVLA